MAEPKTKVSNPRIELPLHTAILYYKTIHRVYASSIERNYTYCSERKLDGVTLAETLTHLQTYEAKLLGWPIADTQIIICNVMPL